MGLTFAMVLVLTLCAGLAMAVHNAAVAHNHAREATAAGLNLEAEKRAARTVSCAAPY